MKPMPHNLEAEKNLLGICLTDNSQIDAIVSEVDTNAFYSPKNREIFKAIKELHLKKEVVDQITVGNIVGKDHFVYIMELIDFVVSSVGLKTHIKIVKDAAIKRKIIKDCTELIETTYNPDSQVEEVIAAAQQNTIGLVYNKETRLRHLNKVLSETFEQIEKAYNGEVVGFPSGFSKLDHHTGGFKEGRLYILGARPSVGKSALAKCLTESIARRGNGVLFFSVEMGDTEHAKRHLSAASLVPLWKLDNGHIAESEWTALVQATGELSSLPIWYDDTPYQKISNIIATTRRMKIENNIRFVVVDYIQLLQGEGDSRKREEVISSISRGLKLLAKDLHVAVLGLAQLNRESEKVSRKPQLSDLRESGAIEQDADVVMLLHDEDPKDNELEIVIAKNRQGKKGFVKLIWHKDTVNYEEEI